MSSLSKQDSHSAEPSITDPDPGSFDLSIEDCMLIGKLTLNKATEQPIEMFQPEVKITKQGQQPVTDFMTEDSCVQHPTNPDLLICTYTYPLMDLDAGTYDFSATGKWHRVSADSDTLVNQDVNCGP